MALDETGYLKAKALNPNISLIDYFSEGEGNVAPKGNFSGGAGIKLPSIDLSIKQKEQETAEEQNRKKILEEIVKRSRESMGERTQPGGSGFGMPGARLKMPDLPSLNIPDIQGPNIDTKPLTDLAGNLGTSLGGSLETGFNSTVKTIGENIPKVNIPGMPDLPSFDKNFGYQGPDLTGLSAGIPDDLKKAASTIAPGFSIGQDGKIEWSADPKTSLAIAGKVGDIFNIPGLSDITKMASEILGIDPAKIALSAIGTMIPGMAGVSAAIGGLTAALSPILGPIVAILPLLGGMVREGEHSDAFFAERSAGVNGRIRNFATQFISTIPNNPGWRENVIPQLDKIRARRDALNSHYRNTAMSKDLDYKYQLKIAEEEGKMKVLEAIAKQDPMLASYMKNRNEVRNLSSSPDEVIVGATKKRKTYNRSILPTFENMAIA